MAEQEYAPWHERIEPGISLYQSANQPEVFATISIAISLKRIADVLEREHPKPRAHVFTKEVKQIDV